VNPTVLHEFLYDVSTETRDLGETQETQSYGEEVKFEQIPGWKPSLIFLYTGKIYLHGQAYEKSYEEHEIPPDCTGVYFMGKTRILVIYSRI